MSSLPPVGTPRSDEVVAEVLLVHEGATMLCSVTADPAPLRPRAAAALLADPRC